MSKNATSGGRDIKRGAWQIRVPVGAFEKATVGADKETDESLDNYVGIQSNSHKSLGQPTNVSALHALQIPTIKSSMLSLIPQFM